MATRGRSGLPDHVTEGLHHHTDDVTRTDGFARGERTRHRYGNARKCRQKPCCDNAASDDRRHEGAGNPCECTDGDHTFQQAPGTVVQAFLDFVRIILFRVDDGSSPGPERIESMIFIFFGQLDDGLDVLQRLFGILCLFSDLPNQDVDVDPCIAFDLQGFDDLRRKRRDGLRQLVRRVVPVRRGSDPDVPRGGMALEGPLLSCIVSRVTATGVIPSWRSPPGPDHFKRIEIDRLSDPWRGRPLVAPACLPDAVAHAGSRDLPPGRRIRAVAASPLPGPSRHLREARSGSRGERGTALPPRAGVIPFCIRDGCRMRLRRRSRANRGRRCGFDGPCGADRDVATVPGAGGRAE